MSTVQDTSSVTSLFGAPSSTAQKSTAEELQDRFLNLLVAQMQNQDPLNPLDNAQVTSQLAQLSTVQGIENMGASLAALAESLSSNQVAQAASLIGRGVLVPGNDIGPSPENSVAGFDLAGSTDSVTVTIEDASGATVRTLEFGALPAGVNLIAWDGLQEDGSAAPDGEYSFKLTASYAGTAVTAESLSLGAVNSVSQGSTGVLLNLASGTQVGYADIRQIF
jgi:flagellar basal-body rod modification protein FlgD